MLIKYKTEPTIIVLSPNSANLIKILTQFVYSINIRYFSPSSPVFCKAKYRGGVRRTEGLKKRSKGNGLGCNFPSPAVSRSITGYYVSHIGDTEETIVSKARGLERWHIVFL